MPTRITHRARRLARGLRCLDTDTALDLVIRALARSQSATDTRNLYAVGWLVLHPEYIDGGAL